MIDRSRDASGGGMTRAITFAVLAVLVTMVLVAVGVTLYRAEKHAVAVQADLFQIKERSYALAVELAQMRAALAQKRAEKSQPVDGDDLVEALEELRRWHSVRPIPDLASETLDIGHVKTLRVDIRPFDARVPLAVAEDRAGWEPGNDSDLPYPWPTRDGETVFSAFYYAVNASIIMRRWRATGDKRFLALIAGLEAARERETVREGTSAFIAAEHPLALASSTLPAGWRSAFSNAFVVVGLLDLHEATADESYLNLARSYVAGLTNARTAEKLWRIDASQYLWFEEYPAIEGRPTSVINGHIGSVLALHRYWTVTGDKTVLPLIRAGIATAARYMWKVRNPGGISAYWLHDSKTPDYGPVRATNFADALLAISGHRIFRELSDALKTDMPIR
ncbi:hypothetical protein DK26_18380 [Bosea sp. WAO]|uniref:D-glucuronyl C5-epimerase family protein n=1 Tax=Bosea sp. WAO TaxID=406341 RepID=UPI0007463FA6|nr:D-glucuronyl C5-epimerase family protein [Bosea sp. WAO]KUL94826.1 hypothetical protein DK26_18380 [Bosea sp. WAO]